jgi:hypothetical protein
MVGFLIDAGARLDVVGFMRQGDEIIVAATVGVGAAFSVISGVGVDIEGGPKANKLGGGVVSSGTADAGAVFGVISGVGTKTEAVLEAGLQEARRTTNKVNVAIRRERRLIIASVYDAVHAITR